jgi:hypothetical protein
MKTMSKSLVARAALGLVALAGVVAAVPASARPFEHEGGRGYWGHDHGWVERGYGPAYYEGYRPAWRPGPVYAPGYVEPGYVDPAYGPGPVIVPAPYVGWHHFRHW